MTRSDCVSSATYATRARLVGLGRGRRLQCSVRPEAVRELGVRWEQQKPLY